MATMRCEDFRARSDSWMEGQRGAEADAHLSSCGHCRALIADLEAIGNAARTLEDVAPPSRIWNSLRARLEQEGLVHAPRSAWSKFFGSAGLLRPAFAGAYLFLIIGVSVALVWQGNSTYIPDASAVWMRHDQSSMASLQEELGTADANVASLTSASASDVTMTLNRNLAIVDNMISLCEKSVREDPQNEMTRDYLYTAYQQKANLLAAMADSSAEGR